MNKLLTSKQRVNLTPQRRMKVVLWYDFGLTQKQIVTLLFVCLDTVHEHMSYNRAYEKLMIPKNHLQGTYREYVF